MYNWRPSQKLYIQQSMQIMGWTAKINEELHKSQHNPEAVSQIMHV